MQGARFESGLDNSPMYCGRTPAPPRCAPPARHDAAQRVGRHALHPAMHPRPCQVRWRLLRGQRLLGRRVRRRADAPVPSSRLTRRPPLPQPWARALAIVLGSGPSPFEATRQPSSGPPKAADLRPKPLTGTTWASPRWSRWRPRPSPSWRRSRGAPRRWRGCGRARRHSAA